MTKKILLAAGIIGALAIILDGMGNLFLFEQMSEEGIKVFKHALQYQMIHALALIGVVFLNRYFKPKYTRIIYYMFIFGVILSSGSMYLMSMDRIIGKFSFLGPLAVIGGLMLIIGWGSIASLGINNHIKKR